MVFEIQGMKEYVSEWSEEEIGLKTNKSKLVPTWPDNLSMSELKGIWNDYHKPLSQNLIHLVSII